MVVVWSRFRFRLSCFFFIGFLLSSDSFFVFFLVINYSFFVSTSKRVFMGFIIVFFGGYSVFSIFFVVIIVSIKIVNGVWRSESR